MTHDEAYEHGHEHGANAGEWYFDGNTPDGAYETVLAGIEDGDPAILDTFPSFTFGEWAGESCREVFADWDDMTDDEQDEATDEYIRGYDDGAMAMIEQTARNYLGR
jgi:hypothetical protein